jgi:DNA-binding response OmpR family regulator
MTAMVLVYSDDRTVREDVRFALGGRLPELDEPIELVEAATQPAVLKLLDAGDIDLAILDGEAVPAGGMGLAKQVKDEVENCPPVLLLVGRPQDAWLATWSGADAIHTHPIDPIELAQLASRLLTAADVTV